MTGAAAHEHTNMNMLRWILLALIGVGCTSTHSMVMLPSNRPVGAPVELGESVRGQWCRFYLFNMIAFDDRPMYGAALQAAVPSADRRLLAEVSIEDTRTYFIVGYTRCLEVSGRLARPLVTAPVAAAPSAVPAAAFPEAATPGPAAPPVEAPFVRRVIAFGAAVGDRVGVQMKDGSAWLGHITAFRDGGVLLRPEDGEVKFLPSFDIQRIEVAEEAQGPPPDAP